VSEDAVVERMLARGRSDDNEETIRTRLQVYRDETAPLIDFYDEQPSINAYSARRVWFSS
jgi:adenylate kinase